MIRLELSRAADADLVGMLEYGGETFGWEAAEDYLASFERVFALLCEHPRAGAVNDAVKPPIQSIAHRRHRIYYDLLDDRLVVRRILHMTMDVAQHL